MRAATEVLKKISKRALQGDPGNLTEVVEVL